MDVAQISLFLNTLSNRNYSKSTINSYKNVLLQFKKWNSQNQTLDEELIFNYIKNLIELNKSYSMIKNSLIALNHFSEIILSNRIKFSFPSRMKHKTKVPDILSIDEMKRVIDAITNLKHKTIISLIYSCGLRISECIKIKLSDFDTSLKQLRVEKDKEGKIRVVQICPKLFTMLNDYTKSYKPHEHLFQGQNKDVYSARSIEIVLKNALQKCGINKKITVHSLRHSFASHLVEQGTDIRIIQEILGNKDIRSTQIYTHISTVNKSKINNPMDSF